jgi:hypothetical protein
MRQNPKTRDSLQIKRNIPATIPPWRSSVSISMAVLQDVATTSDGG